MTRILDHLEGIRDRGAGQYYAKCPAHNDRSPSLSIKVCDDGRTLVRCFAGCSTDEVLAAVGLRFADLFPTALGDFAPSPPKHRAADLLAALRHEALIVAVAASDIAQGKTLTPETLSRVATAAGRINHVLEVRA